MRYRQVLVFTAIVGPLLVFGCFGLEYAARVHFASVDESHKQRLLTIWDSFHAGVDLTRLSREMEDTARITEFNADGKLYIAHDYHGQYINYENGSRHTSYQPTTWTHTLWMFGNSSLVASTMIDNDTIPSQLQRLINQPESAWHNGWRVVNKGIGAYTAKQEFDYLKKTAIQAGDMIIFYDGVVETDTINIRLSGEFIEYHAAGWLCNQLQELELSRFVCDEVNNPSFGSCEAPGKAVADNYQQVIREAHNYAQAHGATFYAILQPHLYSQPLNAAERALEAELIINNNAKRWGLLTCWPYLQNAISQLQQAGVAAVDLTHVTDWSRHKMSLWYDMTHGTGKGNGVIAQAIFDAITPF